MSWEQPPQGGGTPPAPGPAGGGGGPGGAVPPEQPMAHIPFSDAELGNLTATARAMMIAGVVAIVGALTGIISSLVVGLSSGEGVSVVGSLCGGVLEAIVAGLLGGWLMMGSRSLERVIRSDEADQAHLSDSLTKLRNVFVLKAIYVALIIVLFCVLTGGLAVMGG